MIHVSRARTSIFIVGSLVAAFAASLFYHEALLDRLADDAPIFSNLWPTDTLDSLRVGIETADGRHTTLAATSGNVRIVTMFYTHCIGVCPRVMQTLQQFESELDPAARQRLRVLMISLDPRTDSPAAMRALIAQRRIDQSRWIVGRTDAADVQTIASRLRIAYEPLGINAIDHDVALILVDALGTPIARSSRAGALDADFVRAVRIALGSRQ